jgi:cytochrome P450
MSILLEAEIYKDDEELIIDDIITFFAAGMRTITVSTTNTIVHLLKNPEWYSRVLKEISPALSAAQGNVVQDLSYEKVMEFNNLMLFYTEVLRLEPPIPVGSL